MPLPSSLVFKPADLDFPVFLAKCAMPATKVHNAITTRASCKAIPGPKLVAVTMRVDPPAPTRSELLEEIPNGACSYTRGCTFIKIFCNFAKQNARAATTQEADGRVRAAATKACVPLGWG